MDRNEQAREAADRLATLLSDQRGTEAILALQRLLRVSQAEAPPERRDDCPPYDPPAPGQAAPRLGVWEVIGTLAGPGLRRLPDQPVWETCVWSADGNIPGKGGARRVVLVGESVARGYLMDPVYNPAVSLRRCLETIGSPHTYQCVDLAKTSVALPELRQIVRQVPSLDPDVLVVFAGNNWSTASWDVPHTDYPHDLPEILRSEGYPGVREALVRRFVLPRVEALLCELVRLRDRRGVRLVFVLPEFNLRGWSALGAGVAEIDVPMLPGQNLVRWYTAKSRALRALADADWAVVRRAATEMAELDGGLSPVPGHLLGRALEAQGDTPGARRAYERSRDSVHGLPVKHLPRMSRLLQDTVRAFCRDHGVDCVDLSRLLESCDTPELPDPRHFLDYCHLSRSGIDLAMGEVARLITGAVEAPKLAADDPWVDAVGLLMAAAYNAFSDQPPESVTQYLRRAVDTDPRIRELMITMAGLLDRPGGPLWSGTGFADLIREPNAAVVLERLGDYRPDRSRLWSLRRAMAQLLGPDALPSPRPAAAAELLDIATTTLGFGAVPNFTPSRCYLQANTMGTRITAVLAQPRDRVLRLIHRRREGEPGSVLVRVNGTQMASFASAPRWSTTELLVPASALRAGLNLIDVVWPGPAVTWETRIAQDADALARGEHPYVLPVFGELFSARLLEVPDGTVLSPSTADSAGSGG